MTKSELRTLIREAIENITEKEEEEESIAEPSEEGFFFNFKEPKKPLKPILIAPLTSKEKKVVQEIVWNDLERSVFRPHGYFKLTSKYQFLVAREIIKLLTPYAEMKGFKLTRNDDE